MHKNFQPAAAGGLTWLDIDASESRYLLASTVDSSVVLYDSIRPSSQATDIDQQHCALGKVDKNSPGGHKFCVSCVAWYPVDTGLFVTGAYDNSIKVSWLPDSLSTVVQQCWSGWHGRVVRAGK